MSTQQTNTAKIKWLSVSVPFQLPDTIEKLSALQFRRGCTHGIDLIDFDHKSIKCKFIEEIIDIEEYIDPFGEEIRNEIHRYSEFFFSIYAFSPENHIVRVSDPPRSIRSFTAFLSDSLGFGLSTSAIKLDVIKFIELLKENFGERNCSIKKVRVANIHISESSLARIDATSSRDAYIDLGKSMDLSGCIVERATIDLFRSNRNERLDLTYTGMLAGERSLIDELTPLCIEFFTKQKKSLL